MNQLLQWWQERAGREQAALVAAAVLLILTAGYLAVEPMLKEAARKRAEIPQLRSDLRWMQARVDDVRELRRQGASGAAAGNGGPILGRIEETARAQGIRGALSELQGQGSAGARVELEGVAFPALLDWLSTLRARAGIVAVEADIRRREEGGPGWVDARLVLRRPGGEGS